MANRTDGAAVEEERDVPGGCRGRCSHLDFGGAREVHDKLAEALSDGTAESVLWFYGYLCQSDDGSFEQAETLLPWNLGEFMAEHNFSDPVRASRVHRMMEEAFGWRSDLERLRIVARSADINLEAVRHMTIARSGEYDPDFKVSVPYLRNRCRS